MNDKGPDHFTRRTIVLMLAAIVGSELALILGRGILCAIKDGCNFDEFMSSTEMLNALLATLIALVFAVTGRGPPE